MDDFDQMLIDGVARHGLLCLPNDRYIAYHALALAADLRRQGTPLPPLVSYTFDEVASLLASSLWGVSDVAWMEAEGPTQ